MSTSKAAKHVSRACLECRSRHMKCGGQQPKCERCVRTNRECQYVKSNRGGSRKRGTRVIKPSLLPCVQNGLPEMSHHPGCTNDCLKVDNMNKIPPCMVNVTITPDDDSVDFYPKFNATQDKTPLKLIFDPELAKGDLNDCFISPVLTKDLNLDSIVETFYSHFYSCHPFLPPKEHINEYLGAIPVATDLILAMKFMGDGQTSGIYSKDSETVNFLVTTILEYVKQLGKDFISLQTMLILAMIAHISSLHDLSVLLREALIEMTLEFQMNYLDEMSLPADFIDVNGNIPAKDRMNHNLDALLQSQRVRNIPKEILYDSIRRTFWEIYFFDTLSGTASGQYKSPLAMNKCFTFYPLTCPREKFDYKSRSEMCKLVNDSISLNMSIQSRNNSYQTHLTHMQAALGNWEMKMANPDNYQMPYLINLNGEVNEGLFEALVLLNYARIFTHRPFSYLWRSDVSKHPRCTSGEGVDDPCDDHFLLNFDHRRKIIETRRTIDSANSFIKTILDTDASNITKRMPFIACGLAFSSLVHLSAYSWVDANLKNNESNNNDINYEELGIYSEYIKLEIGSILQITHHWSLSRKLVQHIVETIIKVSKPLWDIVERGIPELKTLNLNLNSSKKVPPSLSSPHGLSDEGHSTTTTDDNHYNRSSDILASSSDSRSNSTSAQDYINDFNDLELNLMASQQQQQQQLQQQSQQPQTTQSQSDFAFNLNPLSPSSDTGCDWVDKHVFEFDPTSLNIGYPE